MNELKSLKKDWKLDRNVPVIPGLLVIIQILAFVCYAAKLDSRVSVLETKAVTADTLIERVTRMEEQIRGVKEQGTRIETKIDSAIVDKRTK